MKLAAVHCWTTPWWALEVLKDLIKEEIKTSWFSNIKIFTTYSEIQTISIGDIKIQIVTALPNRLNSFFQRNSKKKLPILWWLFDYRNLMFFYPLLMKIISQKIKKYSPDKILISSFAIAKNIEQCKNTSIWSVIASGNEAINYPSEKKQNTTLYLHSPMQYIRSHREEYQQKLTGWKWRIFRQIISYLQKRDLKYTQYNKVYVNSKYTQKLAKEIYNIESEVKYPKVNQIYFDEKIVDKPKDYVVCIWRVVKFVREIDIIIKAFNKINYPLIIIGSGPDEQELKKLANKNISFTWRGDPANIINIIKNAKGAINLTKESFGLSTAECLCLWVPVLWYNQGATPELLDKESGITIWNKKDLEHIFSLFINKKWNREQISLRARKIFTPKQ